MPFYFKKQTTKSSLELTGEKWGWKPELAASASASSGACFLCEKTPWNFSSQDVLEGSCEEGVGTGFRDGGRGRTLWAALGDLLPWEVLRGKFLQALLLPPALVSRAHTCLFHSPCFHFLFQGNSANSEVFLLLVDLTQCWEPASGKGTHR